MPGHGQFVERERARRRETVSPVSERVAAPTEPPTSTGILNFNYAEFLDKMFGAGLDVIDKIGSAQLPGPDLSDPNLYKKLLFGSDPEPAPGSPGETGTLVTDAESRLVEASDRLDILKNTEAMQIPFAQRQLIDAFRKSTEEDVANITEEIRAFNEQLELHQANFETGSQFLEALGLPTTVQAAREDPEIDAKLNTLSQAITSGRGIDEAIDALATLGKEELSDLGEAFGRDRYLSELQGSIRIQIGNLVENRQQVEESLVEFEDFVALETQAQENPIWDPERDLSPSGRGSDVMLGSLEPWLEANVSGLITTDQFALVATALLGIWNEVLPTIGEEDEVAVDLLSPTSLQRLEQISQANILLGDGTTIQGLGFSEEQTLAFIEQVRSSLERGRVAAETAEEWKTATRLDPNEAPMAAAITETASNIYEDIEIVSAMANSRALYRIIQIRSDGNTVRDTSKMGDQFGLGNLPVDTYERLNYNINELDSNPALQMEALLHFIGIKYAPGYEGLMIALSDLIHNPDGWGDLD